MWIFQQVDNLFGKLFAKSAYGGATTTWLPTIRCCIQAGLRSIQISTSRNEGKRDNCWYTLMPLFQAAIPHTDRDVYRIPANPRDQKIGKVGLFLCRAYLVFAGTLLGPLPLHVCVLLGLLFEKVLDTFLIRATVAKERGSWARWWGALDGILEWWARDVQAAAAAAASVKVT